MIIVLTNPLTIIGYLCWSSLHDINRETGTAMYYSFAFLLAWWLVRHTSGHHIISYYAGTLMYCIRIADCIVCFILSLFHVFFVTWVHWWFLVIHVWSALFLGFSLPGHLDAQFFMVGALVMFTVGLCNNTHRVQLQLLELKGLPLKKITKNIHKSFSS